MKGLKNIVVLDFFKLFILPPLTCFHDYQNHYGFYNCDAFSNCFCIVYLSIVCALNVSKLITILIVCVCIVNKYIINMNMLFCYVYRLFCINKASISATKFNDRNVLSNDIV